jgi:hypothetical protein
MVLQPDEAHWNLDFSEIIRIGMLHPANASKPFL